MHPIYVQSLQEEIAAQNEVEKTIDEPIAQFVVPAFSQANVIETSIDEPNAQLVGEEISEVNGVESMKAKIELLEKRCKELEERNTKLVKDNQVLKKLLNAAKNLNLCKDAKIQNMKAFPGLSMAKSDDGVSAEKYSKQMLFAKHEQHFTSAELKTLRSIGKGKRQDAAFVTHCVNYLYKGNTMVIANKCSGNRKLKGKTLISPDKKDTLSAILQERIESEGTDEMTGFDRTSRFTRLVGDAIYNIAKRPAPNNSNMEHSATTNENSSVQTVNYQLVEQRPNPVPAANFDAFNYVSLAPFMPIYGQNYVFQNQS